MKLTELSIEAWMFSVEVEYVDMFKKYCSLQALEVTVSHMTFIVIIYLTILYYSCLSFHLLHIVS